MLAKISGDLYADPNLGLRSPYCARKLHILARCAPARTRSARGGLAMAAA